MPDSEHKIPHKQPDYSGVRIAAVSLGCSKNRIDTEEVLGQLRKWGCVLTEDYRSADVIFVNTCSFIEAAQQESIDTLLEMSAGTRGEGPKIVAAGCLVELFGNKIIRSLAEVDGAIGVHSYRRLDRFMKLLLAGKRTVIRQKPSEDYFSLAPRVLTTPAHSADIKIGEGCSNRCSYCLIPGIRGPYRSRPPGEIVAEAEGLLQKGTREINLIAQDTTAYGTDQEGLPDLAGLIRQILSLEDDFRLRIMYTYPSRITDDLISLIADQPRICNYLDIPIQHSSDRVLSLMGRKYGSGDLTELVKRLRTKVPDIALRTTCMVGYPGESRREFGSLLRFITEQAFDRLGAFTYSPQKGTAAYHNCKQVPQRVSKKRLSELMITQQKIAQGLNSRMIGRTLTVLVDKARRPGSRWYYGRTEYQAPEVDGGVYFRSVQPLLPGDWVTVRICAASPYNLMAIREK